MPSVDSITEKVLGCRRITDEDALFLFGHPDLTVLGVLADFVRRGQHPEGDVTYNIGRNINYTNVCWVGCSFCAFHRPPGSDEGYLLSKEEIFAKIEEAVALGGSEPYATEVLMQGGLDPRLKIDYFEDILGAIKARFPVHIHSLSATEIIGIARASRLTIEEALVRLGRAGLDSLPGAGAEILDDHVRSQVSCRKEKTEEWLGVHRTAHKLGIRSTATMLYGTLETAVHRVNHLRRIRDLQDETGGFTAFIPWNFQSRDTRLGLDDRWLSRRRTSGFDYLRTVAVSRLYLDNIPSIQASWVTQGPKIAQVSLKYGVNDFGSTVMEENVVGAAGTRFVVSVSEIRRLIAEAGYRARRRNTRYELLE